MKNPQNKNKHANFVVFCELLFQKKNHSFHSTKSFGMALLFKKFFIYKKSINISNMADQVCYLTITSTVFLIPLDVEMVILHFPTFLAVILPVLETVAIFLLDVL